LSGGELDCLQDAVRLLVAILGSGCARFDAILQYQHENPITASTTNFHNYLLLEDIF